jgi:thiol-disulfide isomerase/thioredoxin
MKRIITPLILGALIIGGYFAYRSLPTQPSTAPATAEEAAEQSEQRPEPATTLPDFSLANLSGEQQSIYSWPGDALVINFWATWCAPCLREIPLLKTFQDAQRENGVTVVGIAVDRPDPVADFAQDMSFNYPVLVGQAEGMEAAASFGVDFFALPFTVFVDGDRNVLGVHTGELHAEDLENVAAVFAAVDRGEIDLETARDRVAGRI